MEITVAAALHCIHTKTHTHTRRKERPLGILKIFRGIESPHAFCVTPKYLEVHRKRFQLNIPQHPWFFGIFTSRVTPSYFSIPGFYYSLHFVLFTWMEAKKNERNVRKISRACGIEFPFSLFPATIFFSVYGPKLLPPFFILTAAAMEEKYDPFASRA